MNVSYNAYGQTVGQTDGRIMPIADHTAGIKIV